MRERAIAHAARAVVQIFRVLRVAIKRVEAVKLAAFAPMPAQFGLRR
jgi:hypothetical protein